MRLIIIGVILLTGCAQHNPKKIHIDFECNLNKLECTA